VTPSIAPASENGVSSMSSDLSASREKREPRRARRHVEQHGKRQHEVERKEIRQDRHGEERAPNVEMPNAT
jgi:hypothetical protein